MHLRVSQKNFILLHFFVYTVAVTTHENRSFSFQTFYTFLKIHHKIFNSSKLVNFFLSEGGPSLAYPKNINFIGRECPNFEGNGWKYRDISGINVSFFPKHSRFP